MLRLLWVLSLRGIVLLAFAVGSLALVAGQLVLVAICSVVIVVIILSKRLGRKGKRVSE